MTFVRAKAQSPASLPQLRGGLLWAYRFAWSALVLTAAAILALSLIRPETRPIIIGLRLAKGVVLIAVATILFRRRQRDPVAALLSLCFVTWTITSSVDFTLADTEALLLDRLRFLLFALALLLFPDGDWRPAWTRKIAVVSGAVFLIGVAETLQLLPTRLFLPLAIPCVLAAIASLVSRFRSADSEALRLQLKWVALGLVSGVGLILLARGGAFLSSRSAAADMTILWETFFQLGIVLVAVGFLISLLRYRLFDAETAITRSAAFAGLTVALVATFAGTEAAIESVGQQYLGMGIGNISAAMGAAVAAVLLNPFHSRISDWAEQHFQRDLVMLKRALPEVLEDLAASATPKEIGAVVLSHVNEAVHATGSALIGPAGAVIATRGVALKDARSWSREALRVGGPPRSCERNDPVFPVRIELPCPFSGKRGWLLLGPRPDGSLYGKEDLGALDSIRPAIRQALAWATARETSRKTANRKWQSLRREMTELRHRLISVKCR